MENNNDENLELIYDENITLQVYDKNNNTLDYTKSKLKYLINKSYSPKTIKSLIQLLKDYESRKIAIGWKKGEPVYIELKT